MPTVSVSLVGHAPQLIELVRVPCIGEVIELDGAVFAQVTGVTHTPARTRFAASVACGTIDDGDRKRSEVERLAQADAE